MSPRCTSGDARLADGANEFDGRVDICHQESWLPVCGDSFQGMGLVCNQLGINSKLALIR